MKEEEQMKHTYIFLMLIFKLHFNLKSTRMQDWGTTGRGERI